MDIKPGDRFKYEGRIYTATTVPDLVDESVITDVNGDEFPTNLCSKSDFADLEEEEKEG